MSEPSAVAESLSGKSTHVGTMLRRAVPALIAFVAIRVLGILVLNAFAAHPHHWLTWWDAQWYEGIARSGYGFTRVAEDGRLLTDYAFFPLYPLFERLVAAVTGLRYVDAGLLVSAVASLFAAWGIFAVGDLLYGRRVGVLLTVLWASLPVSVVESMAYSESLFTALAAWALYAVVTGRWVWAGTFACLAGLTRPTGAAVAAAVIIPAALTVFRHGPEESLLVTGARSGRLRPLAGAAVAPLGWLGWVGYRTGSVTGYFAVADQWGNGFDAGAAFARWTWGFLASPDFVLGVLVCLGVVAVLWLLALGIRQHQPLPLLIFTAAMVFMAFTTAGYFGSKPRYLLPAFPLLLPLASWLARQRTALLVPAFALIASTSAIFAAHWLLGGRPPP